LLKKRRTNILGKRVCVCLCLFERESERAREREREKERKRERERRNASRALVEQNVEGPFSVS